MISLKRNYKTARQMLNDLQKTWYPGEAFAFSSFFIEKILRRTLLQLMILKGSGMTFEDAVQHMTKAPKTKLKGFWAIKNAWKNWDAAGRDLEIVIGSANWKTITDAAEKRNALVHGYGRLAENIYKKELPRLLSALDDVVRIFSAEYKYHGWNGMKDKAGKKI